MNNMNVLLVTYSFPPVGGTGVMRATSLARYLPAEGIRLDVLTARNASGVGSDPTLLSDIPVEVTIHRAVTLDLPFSIKKLIRRVVAGKRPSKGAIAAGSSPGGKPTFLKRALQDIMLPDPQVAWLPVLTRTARHIVRKRNIDLVIITVPPFSSTLLVERLRKEFPHLPIVIDFRDEWLTTNFDLAGFLFSTSENARNFARKTEARAVTCATAVVAVTEAARVEIRNRYSQEPDGKFHLIPNGYDAATLRRSRFSPASRTDGKIVVAHVGTINPVTDPTTLAEALQSLPPEVKSRFLLRFIGHIQEPRFREALLQLGDMVELKGFLPQHEALAMMNEADYVLLINDDPLNVSSKFYDYVGGGKPILGAVHAEGETRLLFDELRAGWWAGNHDADGIRRLFLDAAARGSSLLTEYKPDTEKIAKYERKVLAKRYADLLHSIAGSQSQYDSPTSATQLVGPEQ